MASESPIDPAAIAKTFGDLLYMNSSMTLVVAGIQLFMCLYNLSLYFETPKEKRRGRLPYILASFVIFVLFSIATSVDALFVHDVYETAALTSTPNILVVYRGMVVGWNRWLSGLSVVAFIAVGDGVLVSDAHIDELVSPLLSSRT
jgi:hypothetical protein